MADVCLPLSAGEDMLQLKLEAVKKQIRDLMERQTQPRERRAALETSRDDTHKSGVSIQRPVGICEPGPGRNATLPGAVVLHAGVNATKLRQTETLKRDFRSLIETVRRTSPATTIIVSGPLPTTFTILFVYITIVELPQQITIHKLLQFTIVPLL
uniref:Uncharacterized protein n=1 Tax=Sinocyclocheilus anshuiensis TaxID=1608454 RepID=A0A671P9Z3_9TELE